MLILSLAIALDQWACENCPTQLVAAFELMSNYWASLLTLDICKVLFTLHYPHCEVGNIQSLEKINKRTVNYDQDTVEE